MQTIPIREALTKSVARNIISDLKEKEITPFEYLAEIAIIAELTETDKHRKDGIAQYGNTLVAVMHPNPTEEEIWRMIGTIRLRHYWPWPQVITDRPKELEYFLELVKKDYCNKAKMADAVQNAEHTTGTKKNFLSEKANDVMLK